MPDYYNKAFQGGPSIGKKPEERFRSGLVGQLDPISREIGRIPAVGKVMGGVSKFMGSGIGKMMFDPLGISGSLFGSNDKPSNREMLMYHYSKVGALQARAEAETNPKRLAELQRKLNNNKGKVEKYAYKMDKRHRPGGKFLPPRTFDEIDEGRKAYMEKMTAGPDAPTRTITRTL